MARKGYPAEFRRRALDLVAAGKPVAEVARLLEVSDQSIYSWRRQELIDRGELPGLSSEEREELRAARARIRALEIELAVHRRAAELLKESVRPKALRGGLRDGR
jgi:transposase-like protein